MNKLEQFKRRNQKRNSQLYSDYLTENIDYILCPVSNERLSMIKTTYIERVLEMTVAEYDKLFPGVRGVTPARRKNIKDGLKEIDKTSGLTKHQLACVKSKQTLSSLDSDGVSGYAKLGKKTRATHMNNIDQFGRNGYSQLATHAIVKGNNTKVKKGIILDPALRNEFYRYKSIVLYLTEKQRSAITTGYKTGVAGVAGAYHIDHIYSILQGYKDNVSPLLIGSKSNLQMLPWHDNLSKHGKCTITLDTLFNRASYNIDRSKSEFDVFLNMIRYDIKESALVSGAMLIERFNETNLRT